MFQDFHRTVFLVGQVQPGVFNANEGWVDVSSEAQVTLNAPPLGVVRIRTGGSWPTLSLGRLFLHPENCLLVPLRVIQWS